MIKQESVQKIIDTAKVEDVVGDFVNLKRRGVNLLGLCPFHNEKTPSFTVSPAKNIYKCFGCGESGNSVSFLMAHQQLSYPEALRYLAKKYGIEIEEQELSPEALQEKQHFESLYIVNEFAKDFYKSQLHTDIGKSVGLSYFSGRGFTPSTIDQFDLGFIPDKKDLFTLTAIQKGYDRKLLDELKLTNQYGGDFFRDRVMFTIHNLSGKVVGFAGRTLRKDKKIPKYINSPETPIYNKSKILYGAFQGKQQIRKADNCILVEGYTDVISMHQAGLENTVASSGTSLTVGQIRLIKRFTSNVTMLFDGDAAGIKAALRGVDLVLEQGMNVKIVSLPEGDDPDSYVKSQGKEGLVQYMDANAKDFIFFKTDLLLAEAGNDPIKKTDVIRSIVESISKIPDPLKKSLYIKECADLVKVDEAILLGEINKLVAKAYKKQRIEERVQNRPGDSVFLPSDNKDQAVAPKEVTPSSKKADTEYGDTFQEKDIVRILINGGDRLFDKKNATKVAQYILANISDVIDDFESEIYKKIIVETKIAIKKAPKKWTNFFTDHSDPGISKLAIDLVTSPYEYSENWEKRWNIFLQTQKMPDENFLTDTKQSLMRFKLKKIIKKCKENQTLISELSKKGDAKKLVLHLKVQQKLNEMRNNLAKELGTVVF